MRTLALLLSIAFLSACGGSSTPGSGYVRFANLSPDVALLGSVDACVAPTGTGAWGTPVMQGAGLSAGLVYGGQGLAAGALQVSRYFSFAPGTYDVVFFSKTLQGSSCTSPDGRGTVVVTEGGYATVALVGLFPSLNVPDGVRARAVAFADTVTPPTGQAAVRVVNAGIGDSIPPPTPIAAFDLGFTTASTGYVKIFGNVAYPGVAATGVDAKGYAAINPAGMPSSGVSLTLCWPTGATPATGLCDSTPIPSGGITGGIVAGIYLIGGTQAESLTMLFCGDVVGGTIQTGVTGYSACTSAL